MYFCLNVMTTKEDDARLRVSRLLEVEGCEDFLVWFPKKEVRERRQGHYETVERPLFPSYIFIFWGGEREMDFPFHKIRKLPNVIRILEYDDGTHNLKGKDMSYAKWIHMHDGFIKQSKVIYKPGQKLHITEGPLKGFDGNVVKVDKHHKRITLRFELGGIISEVSFTVEFLSASSTTDAPDKNKL
jgi:transcriptional antiterminator NusG